MYPIIHIHIYIYSLLGIHQNLLQNLLQNRIQFRILMMMMILENFPIFWCSIPEFDSPILILMVKDSILILMVKDSIFGNTPPIHSSGIFEVETVSYTAGLVPGVPDANKSEALMIVMENKGPSVCSYLIQSYFLEVFFLSIVVLRLSSRLRKEQ